MKTQMLGNANDEYELSQSETPSDEVTYYSKATYEKWRIYYIKNSNVPEGYSPKFNIDASNFDNFIESEEKLYYKKVSMVEPEQTLEDMWYNAEMHDMALTMWCNS